MNKAYYHYFRANPERWGNLTKHPVPYNMTLTKGSLHVALTREFVDFVLHSEVSRDFQNWLQYTQVPDETFFSSLNHNPQLGVPGAHNSKFEPHPLGNHY